MISFEIKGNNLYLIYEPFPDVERSFRYYINRKQGYNLKKTFHITKDVVAHDKQSGCYYFSIAEKVEDYYKLNNDVFGISHNFFFDQNIAFSLKLFVAHRDISIVRKIDRIINSDVYIKKKRTLTENDDCVIPYSEYKKLLSLFPGSGELTRYADMRIGKIIEDYVEVKDGLADRWSKNIQENVSVPHFQALNCNKLQIFKTLEVTLSHMLDESEKYSEKDWQERIAEIILLLFPKYIYFTREKIIGSDGRHKKKPDFLLVDSEGYIDVLEIKLPNCGQIMSKKEYRNNYIPSVELSGSIEQTQKYLKTLDQNADNCIKKLSKSLKGDVPPELEFRVSNPQGMIIVGRKDVLNKEQLEDFEIVKRQNKDIIDIMTYDDLLSRLKNIVKMLELEK